jgi:poly(A) polymerase
MVTEAAERLADRLRLSRAESAVLSLYADCASRRDGPDDARTARERLYRAPDVSAYRFEVLSRWSWSGEGADAGGWRQNFDLPARWTAPRFPLSGQDVLDLGVPAGPVVGELLRAAEQDWINEDFRSDRAALLSRLKDAARRH